MNPDGLCGMVILVPTPDFPSTLVAQLRADLSQRWRQGVRLRIEDYLRQHPTLAGRARLDPRTLGPDLDRSENSKFH